MHALACVSQTPRKLLEPGNFSELFSGLFGFRKVFLKAPVSDPNYLPWQWTIQRVESPPTDTSRRRTPPVSGHLVIIPSYIQTLYCWPPISGHLFWSRGCPLTGGSTFCIKWFQISPSLVISGFFQCAPSQPIRTSKNNKLLLDEVELASYADALWARKITWRAQRASA